MSDMDEVIVTRRTFIDRALRSALALAVLRRSVMSAVAGNGQIEQTSDFDGLSFLDGLTIRRRASWAKLPAVPWRMKASEKVSKLTVHHSGAGTNKHVSEERVSQQLNAVLAGHVRLRYGDLGYHFVVDYTGRIWEGRALSYEGAHVAGANAENVGIMVLGNFEDQRPSRAQLAGLGELVQRIRRHYEVPVDEIYGHRDLGASACPGGSLYPYVDLLRQG